MQISLFIRSQFENFLEKSTNKTSRPLIEVVRIYTKADALSTGAVIVDLPGVHDSNAARAAVAAGKHDFALGLFE